MKKSLILVFAVLLTASLCYAQTPRGASVETIGHVGRTNFTNVGILGLDVSGNPGYIALTASQDQYLATQLREYYLWVGNDGNLCMASYATLKGFASFPNGDWSTGIPCSKVGSQ